MIMDAAGHLYGTTGERGPHGGGTAFELIPNADKTTWTHKILYGFCAQENCTDGSFPVAGVIVDKAGHLYGTTGGGGAGGADGAKGNGTVFELIPNAAKTTWTETKLLSFCAVGGTSCADGGQPSAGVIMDTAGHLYGTTSGRGARGYGTVFELTPNAARTTWIETVLHSFCTHGGTSCADGAEPFTEVIMDTAGHLYGTTNNRGAGGEGTVFELTL